MDHNSTDAGVLKSGINYTCCCLSVYTLFNTMCTFDTKIYLIDIMHSYNKLCNDQIDFLDKSLYTVNYPPLIVYNFFSITNYESVLFDFGTYHNIDKSLLVLCVQLFLIGYASFDTFVKNSS